MKRKMLAAFLAATMVGGLLVGCGNSGDTSGSSKSSSGTTSTASASGEADASVTKQSLVSIRKKILIISYLLSSSSTSRMTQHVLQCRMH